MRAPASTPTPVVLPATPTNAPEAGQTGEQYETKGGLIAGSAGKAGATETTTPAPATAMQIAPAPPPMTRTVRIGLNGRNDIGFHESDYRIIQAAKIETLKMLSLTKPEVFARARAENPDIEFIVRLYDDRMGLAGHPTPEEFAAKMSPIINSLQPYVTKFEIGNEPNHYKRYEGWGPDDKDAEDFKGWFLAVYDLLKTAHPWAEFGFPALGTPNVVHRDRAWLEINREAIERADWLGVHCYWQTPPDRPGTMFDEEHGLCFTYYHAMFPDKPIELTEFANDNIYYNLPLDSEENIAQQYIAYYQELLKYPYIRSASGYILSSPDPAWEYFTWRDEDGRLKPVITEVANMPRPVLVK
jgi:hypothetical protein